MNLFETLRKFKSVKPDSSYTEQSKRVILASQQLTPAMSPFRGILQFIETGAAVALAGFFIILITGAFSNSGYVTPVQYSVIDSAGLHAEAQAIDIQIQLANVSYPDATSTNNGSTQEASTPATSARTFSAAIAVATSSASTPAAAQSSTPSAVPASSTASVDSALQTLSQ